MKHILGRPSLRHAWFLAENVWFEGPNAITFIRQESARPTRSRYLSVLIRLYLIRDPIDFP